MKYLPLLIPAAFFLVAIILVTCNGCTRHGLPHRPITQLTNWGQGRNPGSNDCPPGTVRFELDDGLFLECMR